MFFTPERIALLLCLVGGYFFGLIQTGYFIAKGKNVDIKHLGSGNTGATNVWRVMGAPWGLLTLVCDVAKTLLAILIANLVIVNLVHYDIPYHAILLYTGLGVVLGHDFPAYLRFKGGKGIACSFAIFACFKEWQYILAGAVIFFIVLLISRYVSLSSIVTMIIEFIVFIVCTLMNITYISREWLTDCNVIMALLVIIALFTHRKNIVRLFVGNENKFTFKKVDLTENNDDDDDDDEDEFEEESEEELEENENLDVEVLPVQECEEKETEIEEETEVEEVSEEETQGEETAEEKTEVEEVSEEETEVEEVDEEEKAEDMPFKDKETENEIDELESSEKETEAEEKVEETEAEEKKEQSLPRVVNVVTTDWKSHDI